MELFKNGNKVFAVFPKSEFKREEAIKEANKHFKVAGKDLEVQQGKMLDENTVVFSPAYKGNMWVVSRKGAKA